MEVYLDSLDERYMWEYLKGYADYSPVAISPQVEQIIAEETPRILAHAEPRAKIKRLKIAARKREGVLMEDGTFFRSIVFSLHCRNAEELVMIACTIGGWFDEEVDRILARGEPTRGFIFNALGSAAVETVGELMTQNVYRQERLRRNKCGLRYSAGYADFTLQQQRRIFELIEPEELGIHLSEYFIISPVKSITAFIPVGPNVVEDKYPCEICDKCNVYECHHIHEAEKAGLMAEALEAG
ncbi:MAG: hypothetical protein ABI743_08075 [bacterium]